MRSERTATLLIVGSRALSESVGLAAFAAVLHAIVVGRAPIPLISTSVALFGVTLVVTAMLRERGTVRQSAGLVAAVVVGWSAWGLSQPARAPDAVAVLTRVIGFAILGEAYLWRALGIARGLHRWREVRNDTLLALFAVVVAALVPGPIDRDALAALGLAVACAGAVALSLARSAEELSLATGQIHGRATGSSATGTAFALGVLALAVGFALPSLQALAGDVARAAGPLISGSLYLILLPLGYVAAYLVNIVLWLRERLGFTPVRIETPRSPFGQDEAERLRELEQMRPFVFGALELLVGAVALGVALVLIARLVQERRALFPEGAALEREAVEGVGLRATLRGLFPRGAPRRRAPADDGSPAAAVRRLYWRLLEIAEREGPGWRAPAETPAEHEERLVATAARWRGAAPLVRAFEALRYGERQPDGAAVADAREALRGIEAGPPGRTAGPPGRMEGSPREGQRR